MQMVHCKCPDIYLFCLKPAREHSKEYNPSVLSLQFRMVRGVIVQNEIRESHAIHMPNYWGRC